MKERFAGAGVAIMPSSAAEVASRIKREAAVYKVIVEKANVHVD